jgi:hypothetical protein
VEKAAVHAAVSAARNSGRTGGDGATWVAAWWLM